MVSLNSSSGSAYKNHHFSSGNPRIEETTGVMHLFPHNSPTLPVGRKPLIYVLGVPNHMPFANFCQFCASFLQHVSACRSLSKFDNMVLVVRNDEREDKFSILIRFDEQNSADGSYEYCKGRHFNSLEYSGYKGSVEYSQSSPVSSSEQPWCPVCLEKLDLDASGTLTTICNHSFHISCISRWTDSSCPVCRCCQQQPEKSICFVCQTSKNLWICGFVGCGRYKGGHTILHWKETQHYYSLELETQHVWIMLVITRFWHE